MSNPDSKGKDAPRPQGDVSRAGQFPAEIGEITEVRSDYLSARLILANLEHRAAGTVWERPPGYTPSEIDYLTSDGASGTIAVRDYDVRYLDRVSARQALEHLNLIHLARRGHSAAAGELARRTAETRRQIGARFAGVEIAENEHVIPYTTATSHPETQVSHKGSILIELSRQGFATADFTLLGAGVYSLPPAEREERLWEAIRNLEILCGRKFDDPQNPLLIAMRSAMPAYIPGFMPTFLNVGLTPEVLPGLPRRYGEVGAARIRLNNRKTILEALEPECFRLLEKDVRHDLTVEQNLALAQRIESLIENSNPKLLWNAREQAKFFLSRIYRYYENHLDALRNFMTRSVHYPAVIVQRMVCSALDERCYAGVLYSRHPRLGRGVFLQYARAVFGEDLMTGRLPPEESHFQNREDARREFPAVYHFWPRLERLERVFQAPVMVEFPGVHGTFTTLQVNTAEMVGAGMLTAAMDMHRDGRLSAELVRGLVKPYHIRQIESDAIDSKSLHSLKPFCRGISVLPREAVTGRVYFSAEAVREARESKIPDNVVLVKDRFSPTDVIDMQNVSGICSLSPAAIHVVTSAQNLGIPALLNLEEVGVRLDADNRILVNRDKLVIREGDWISISSRLRTLYIGRAQFAPARLLRYMAGEAVELTPEEKTRFDDLASSYREFRSILENVDASRFESLQDLGHAIQYGRLHDDPQKADFVNRCYDANRATLAARLLEVTLGNHFVNLAAFRLLTVDRRVGLLKDALALCREKRVTGYQAGAFVIGSFVEPSADGRYWTSFDPREIAGLLNEWLLYQKYLKVLDAVGERKINRARALILEQGLDTLPVHKGWLADFKNLKSSGVDFDLVRAQIGDGFDPQTAEVLDLIRD
ncbi:MAG: PEP-utilizing enzyme [Candidatus Aminicenantes bacterium]|nr:PEP-utilizing enzyme [Candidatus Aminicenantes bacterium]